MNVEFTDCYVASLDGVQLLLKMTYQLTSLLTGPCNASPAANLSNFVVQGKHFCVSCVLLLIQWHSYLSTTFLLIEHHYLIARSPSRNSHFLVYDGSLRC